VNPEERVRIVTQTAREVLRGDLDPSTGAQVLGLQREQIGDLLRSDRNDVTRSEAETVALTLRRLGEQISDAGRGTDGTHYQDIAAHLGAMSQMLR
jgi:hypothetical protein